MLFGARHRRKAEDGEGDLLFAERAYAARLMRWIQPWYCAHGV
jgi:hypothetical protein